MDYRQDQADVLALLHDSPITKSDIRTDITELVYVGETALAFDTLCSWLYEDSLPITRSFHERLVALAAQLEEEQSVSQLDELVVDPDAGA